MKRQSPPENSSHSFRFRSEGGRDARLLKGLQLAAQYVASGQSQSGISNSTLEGAVYHFLREAGLGEASLARRVTRAGSFTNPPSVEAEASGRDRERTRKRAFREWQREEDSRQRLASRLRVQLSHEEISMEDEN